MSEPTKHRPVRSFVLRQGRLTHGQQRALDTLWEHYGIAACDTPLDLDSVFGRHAPRTLEIGFGNGAALASMAAAHPERDYLGIEVHRPGVGALLLTLEKQGLENVRVISADAVAVLRSAIPDESLAAVHVYFPDPWPKLRHHKRRLIQAPFVELIARKLQAGGYLHMATDWEDYAQHMLDVLEVAPGFCNSAGAGQFSPRPEERPLTRFEQRGQRLGHRVWDLIYTRTD
jgi:tRNA (guanine-N7-)-methyltransferase